YGLALKNELSKTFRLSEDFSLRGYGSIKVEYGRFQKIKEKSGEMKLEVKANDYISLRPEIGAELIYKTPLLGRNFFNAKLGVKYENELGRVGNAKNKARVAHTNADWFNIRGEKEDRRGSVGADLSLGLDNERYGITANIGYDTKGKNKRAGLGLRVIF
ncbi:autotransporter outer membrane beta-barrel domain-containing protein, partial [Fusobacterium russii]|uniref:autotransporter outer membrane beta-barrel domain-containing protein n=1 Tax=Fusobacterium russii TaxID=854 RepID=UPI0003B41F6E